MGPLDQQDKVPLDQQDAVQEVRNALPLDGHRVTGLGRGNFLVLVQLDSLGKEEAGHLCMQDRRVVVAMGMMCYTLGSRAGSMGALKEEDLK